MDTNATGISPFYDDLDAMNATDGYSSPSDSGYGEEDYGDPLDRTISNHLSVMDANENQDTFNRLKKLFMEIIELPESGRYYVTQHIYRDAYNLSSCIESLCIEDMKTPDLVQLDEEGTDENA